MLLATNASCDNISQHMSVTQSTFYNIRATDNCTNYIVSHQPNTSTPYQSYSLALSQDIYQHTEEKRIYQVDKEEFDSHPESFYTTLEYEAKEVQYSHKSFDKVDINFVGIELSYKKYESLFSSKSQLHKHLRDRCTDSI